MAMTKKQLKAIDRHKRIKRKRNIRTNNMSINPMRENPAPFARQLHAYRLWNI